MAVSVEDPSHRLELENRDTIVICKPVNRVSRVPRLRARIATEISAICRRANPLTAPPLALAPLYITAPRKLQRVAAWISTVCTYAAALKSLSTRVNEKEIHKFRCYRARLTETLHGLHEIYRGTFIFNGAVRLSS